VCYLFQIELVLAKILQELKKLHGSSQQGARNLPDLIDGTTAVAGASGLNLIKLLHNLACTYFISKVQFFLWIELNMLDMFCLGPSNGELPLVDIESRLNHRNSRRKRKHSPDESTASDASAPIDPLSDLVLIFIIFNRSSSFGDFLKIHIIYQTCIGFVRPRIIHQVNAPS
jgi:hypothetical protein